MVSGASAAFLAVLFERVPVAFAFSEGDFLGLPPRRLGVSGAFAVTSVSAFSGCSAVLRVRLLFCAVEEVLLLRDLEVVFLSAFL